MNYQLSSIFKNAFVILFLCSSLSVNAQLSKTHYIPPLTNAELGNASPNEQYIYISTPSNTDVNFTIKPVGLGVAGYISGVVSNQIPVEIPMDTDYGQLFVPANQTSTVMNDKGYIIEADSPVYVSVRMLAGGNNRPQAGALVSKGLAALGNTFRVGAFDNQNPQTNYLNFVSVMATEDNTVVNFSDIPNNVIIDNYAGSKPINITLDKGESYILATTCTNYISTDPSQDNRAGLIGALVTSDKPIVVNCGSANGSFFNGTGRDYGIDQIVGLSKVGSEYIFIKGDGENGWENVLIVAHSNNTSIYLNGNTTPIATINAGEYHIIEGNYYSSSGNMYIQTSEPVFAYQGVGATSSEANQGLFFVPPLSCETKGNIDNIPYIDSIGPSYFPGGITVVTKAGAILTVKQNGIPISNNIQGPFPVPGKADYVTYKVLNISDIVTVECSEELYCAYFNYNDAATSGSFYSGFPSPPEINFTPDFNALGICLGNITLEVANPDSFDSFEWYYDDGTGYVATGNTSLQYVPPAIGNYKLIGVIDCTGTTLESYEIPIGLCPEDIDNDGIPDNIDIDNDNDGILNCTESFGDQTIDLSDPFSGNIPVGSYSFSGTVTTQGNAAIAPISGIFDGTFQSDVPVKTNTSSTSVTYNLTFNKPLNLYLAYGSSSAFGNKEIGPDEEFVLRVPNTRTITLLDPDDQLLIDTNYDGIYESGVTMVSAFEIRFKRNGNALPLATGTFGFYMNNVDSVTYIHTNTSDIESKQAVFQIVATCVARDTDGDGIQDALDLDSDNDALPDFLEFTGTLLTFSGIDSNQDGLDDVFDINASALDTDSDGVWDVYDLDSDNDGIFDWIESGAFTLVNDSNSDGMVDGPYGSNGWDDNAESAADSNQLAYQPNDSESDAIYSYMDSDSDGDGCSDVIEADFSDGNGDNYLGDNPPTINTQGLVNNASDGYTNPNPDFLIAAPITIDVQPGDIAVCEGSDNNISLVSSSYDSIQWEVSTDGGLTWNTIVDDANYSDSQTNSLLITNTPLAFNNYNYRAFLNRLGNGCGLYSDVMILTVNALPGLNSPVELIQCDDDDLNTLGYSYFNLTEANDKISSNAANETFSYYTTEAAAIAGDPARPEYISNPTTFENRTISNDIVWVRVENIFNCSSTAELQLKVSSTSIPSNFLISYNECDDFLDINGNDTAENNDRDGISTFDFSAADTTIRNLIPVGQNPAPPRYYRNEADALAEENEITDITNYRNIGYPNSQYIYVRIDSEISNDCLGLGPHILLTVEPLPVANSVTIDRQCDDDTDGIFPFDTSNIESTILGNQDPTDVTISYTDQSGNSLPSPLPNPFFTASQTITIRVTNSTTSDPDGPCYDETTLDFIVDEQPIAYPVSPIIVCDGDAGDIDDDGRYPFDTTNLGSTILGNQSNMDIFYNYIDENGQQINQATTLPNPLISSNQSIQVDVINPINTTCIATTFVDLVVNPLPEFSVESPRIVCTSDPTFVITLDPLEANPSETFDYEWYFEGNLISNNPVLDNVSSPGIYTVTLTKTDGSNCSRTRTIDVQASELAKTTIDDVSIVDISENNTITINTDNIGRGQYEFALQEENTGFLSFQSEPVFTNVRGGFYTLIIRDAICGSIEIPISVVGHPKYFTPNGDGVNDLWQIRGISSNVQPNSIISIYDRYGKLLKQLLATSPGWDGTFKGRPMPANDYWFKVQLQDGRIFGGHFALKR
ncbi:T9SS type B sorting domain-containing protein [Gaetbulibacter aestuarii]|uniref:T9SS type B sorting domain-containing protein n=1 Tax=Gaetbulibacter aestuarii TaxID=1502358 RepID=A0ABW7MY97_9FLAO